MDGFSGAAPPTVGHGIEGSLWLQGYFMDVQNQQ